MKYYKFKNNYILLRKINSTKKYCKQDTYVLEFVLNHKIYNKKGAARYHYDKKGIETYREFCIGNGVLRQHFYSNKEFRKYIKLLAFQ